MSEDKDSKPTGDELLEALRNIAADAKSYLNATDSKHEAAWQLLKRDRLVGSTDKAHAIIEDTKV